MRKVLTAEQFLYKENLTPYFTEMMIEFAKLHVKAALEAAAEKVEIKRKLYLNLSKEEQLICEEVWEEGCSVPSEGIVVYKDSILNAYPYELIK